VFCTEQGVSPEEEFDGLDDGATQIVAIEDGEVIATCRLRFERTGRDRICRLGRLAVARSARRGGTGGRVLRSAEAEAAAAGSVVILVHAQRRAEAFYAGSGFEPEGETFLDAGIRHVAMRKRIGRG
jgi:predicted GNAT family N-acyltransferase